MKNKILIYDDIGTAGVTVLQEALNKEFSAKGILIETVSADAIIHQNALSSNVVAFFMPGGSADYYHLKLGASGKQFIRSYVESGGIYYGICAGAYFAAKKAVFEPQISHLRKINDYGLNLIDAIAIGTLQKELNIKPYEPTAAATAVVLLQDRINSNSYAAYYHGGPWFVKKAQSKGSVIANYRLPDKSLPAVIVEPIGKGLVIVSGVHYETTATALKKCLVERKADYPIARKIVSELDRVEPLRRALFQKIIDYTRV